MGANTPGDEGRWYRADKAVETLRQRVDDSLAAVRATESEFDVAIVTLQAYKDYVKSNLDTHSVSDKTLAKLILRAHQAITKFGAASQYYLIQNGYYHAALQLQNELRELSHQHLADINQVADDLGLNPGNTPA